jgi:guanylate kinase
VEIVVDALQKIDPRDRHLFPINVPATTRPRKSWERHNVDYHFMSTEVFKRLAHGEAFYESGNNRGYMYGSFAPRKLRMLEPASEGVAPAYSKKTSAS